MNFFIKLILIIFATFLTQSCALKNDYKTQEIEFKDQEVAQNIDNFWFNLVEDENLKKLIKKSLTQNFDINQQKSIIEQYMAQLNIVENSLYPSLKVEGKTSYNKISTKGLQGLNPFLQESYRQYESSAILDFEVDLFGRLQKNKERAFAILTSQKLKLEDIENKIAAQIVREYILVASLASRFEILQKKMQNQQKTVNISSSLFKSGIVSKNKLNDDLVFLKQIELEINNLKFQISESFLRIDVLLAQEMGQTQQILNFKFDGVNNLQIVQFKKSLNKPLSSDIIANNAEILSLENQFIAANANVGIAIREYFPRFNFGINIGVEAIDNKNLLSKDAIRQNSGFSVSWRILEFWKIDDEIKKAEAEKKEFLILYKKTILETIFNLEKSANEIKKNEKMVEILQDNLNLCQKNIDLAQSKYNSGIENYNNVILAKDKFYQTKINKIEAEQNYSESIVNFFDAIN